MQSFILFGSLDVLLAHKNDTELCCGFLQVFAIKSELLQNA